MLITQKPKTLTDNISSRVKVKVVKTENDALKLLCGEYVQKDENGVEYFIIPAHQAQYVSEVFTKYKVGEEYLPDEELEKLRTPKVSEPNQEKKIRGNPNWKKKEIAETNITEDGDSE